MTTMIVLAGCATERGGQGLLLVGNDGFMSGELGSLANRLAEETGVAVAIEPTPAIAPTAARIKSALRSGQPVLVIGYSAGCRDIITALGEANGGRVKIFMVEPTYQATHGYAKVPACVSELVCFRIKGGNVLSFSGRFYEAKDFSNPKTKFENIRLSTSSHLQACRDPLVHDRLLVEIKKVMEQERETVSYARAD